MLIAFKFSHSKPYETQQEFRKASITDATTPVPYQLPSYQTKAYSPSGYQPSVSSNSTYKTTTPAGTNDPKPYIPSETCRFVQDMEAGKDLQFNPKTGVEVKSSPIQSKLLDILDKRHGYRRFLYITLLKRCQLIFKIIKLFSLFLRLVS